MGQAVKIVLSIMNIMWRSRALQCCDYCQTVNLPGNTSDIPSALQYMRRSYYYGIIVCFLEGEKGFVSGCMRR